MMLPRLVVEAHEGPPRTVDVRLYPAGKPMLGVADSADLEGCIAVLVEARDFLAGEEDERGA